MQSTERQHTAGGVEAAESVSYFRCPYCGASARSTDVEYDGLGFPECPVCRTRHGP